MLSRKQSKHTNISRQIKKIANLLSRAYIKADIQTICVPWSQRHDRTHSHRSSYFSVYRIKKIIAASSVFIKAYDVVFYRYDVKSNERNSNAFMHMTEKLPS